MVLQPDRTLESHGVGRPSQPWRQDEGLGLPAVAGARVPVAAEHTESAPEPSLQHCVAQAPVVSALDFPDDGTLTGRDLHKPTRIMGVK